jgi:hypothetical protein
LDVASNQYQRLSNKELFSVMRDLEIEIDDFLQYGLGYRKEQYLVCGLDIIDAIIRVDKRLHYFRIFHDMEINECKKAALFAYWIVKLRPITIIDNSLINKVGYKANEAFAVHYLLSILVGVGKVKLWDGHEGVKIDMKNRYIEELEYSFRFRNFTIDSMIVLADAINTESFRATP